MFCKGLRVMRPNKKLIRNLRHLFDELKWVGSAPHLGNRFLVSA